MFVYSSGSVALVGRGVASPLSQSESLPHPHQTLERRDLGGREPIRVGLPQLRDKLPAVSLPVWSVATMDAIPCFLLVLLFGTRIEENTGKWPLTDRLDLCPASVVCFWEVAPPGPVGSLRKKLFVEEA